MGWAGGGGQGRARGGPRAAQGRPRGGPIALTENVVRTKGAEVRKLSVKVTESPGTFTLCSTDI